MPAATMTYTSLVQDIEQYVERGAVDDDTVLQQIPRIINNTERLLADKFKILGYLNAYTNTMQIGVPVISKPQNWRSTVNLNFGTGVEQSSRVILRERGYEYIRSVYPDDLTQGQPVFYCDYDLNNWLVQPTPDIAYPFEAMVYTLPPLLDDTNSENYLTKYAPFTLLYSTLVNMESFLRNDSRVATWKMLAQENFDAINVEDLRRMVDRAQIRSTT